MPPQIVYNCDVSALQILFILYVSYFEIDILHSCPVKSCDRRQQNMEEMKLLLI